MPNGPRDLPCQVTEVRIHRSTNYLAVQFLKFFCPITESNDLRGAHKGEVKRVKEDTAYFSLQSDRLISLNRPSGTTTIALN